MRSFLILFFTCCCITTAFAKGEFKVNNPDVAKYEFGRSYISALSYIHNNETRWGKTPPQKLHPHQDDLIIKTSLDYLVRDNANLRIAKNYLYKYLAVPNQLMRKSADTIIVASDKVIAVNDQEKKLWEAWAALRKANQATAIKEREFINTQDDLVMQRKEITKDVIVASSLMSNVLKSADNANEKGHRLALTSKQRIKLQEKLDGFAADMLDWGIKPGQTTMEASVAVIREILEDPLFKAIDE